MAQALRDAVQSQVDQLRQHTGLPLTPAVPDPGPWHAPETQGLRGLFWLLPSWLVLLPEVVEAGQRSRLVRGLSLAALLVSAFSVGYALRVPWDYPWLLDVLEHLNLDTPKR